MYDPFDNDWNRFDRVGRKATRRFQSSLDNDFDSFFKHVKWVWAGALIGNLIFWGVVIWAIVKLVNAHA